MTMAVSKAVEEGATAVICASTGNTSASAAAYAARAGLTAAVVIPEGKIAAGKLAQALAHGARVLALDGSFDDALVRGARSWSSATRSRWSTRSTSTASTGSAPAPSRSATTSATRPTPSASRWATPGNISAYWLGFQAYREAERSRSLPRLYGFQAAGRRAAGGRAPPVARPETVATAIRIGNPARGAQAMEAMRASGGGVAAVTDSQILDGLPPAGQRGGHLLRAGLGGLGGRAAHPARRGRRLPPGRAGGLRAHRPRPEGPRHRDRQRRAGAAACRPTSRPWRRRSLAELESSAHRQRPGHLGQPRPGLRLPGRGARPRQRGGHPAPPRARSRCTVTGEGAGEVAEDATNLVCRALASRPRLARRPGDRVPQPHPARPRPRLVGRRRLLGPGRRQRPRRPALDARTTCWPARPRSRATPTTPPPASTAGWWPWAPAPSAQPVPVPEGLAFVVVIPEARTPPTRRARALPGERAPGRRRRHALANAVGLTLALCEGRLDDLPPLLEDRLHEPHRGPLVPGIDAIRGLVDGERLPRRDDLGLGPVDAAVVPREDRRRGVAAAAEAALAAAGVAATVRPSRRAPAGVRARWTGGSDLRLARAVG